VEVDETTVHDVTRVLVVVETKSRIPASLENVLVMLDANVLLLWVYLLSTVDGL
jgi:hypothetical protein